MNSNPVERIPCDGLDGSNPLAFLAALGAFRVLEQASSGGPVRLHWEMRRGAWRPLFSLATTTTPEEFLALLDKALRVHEGHPALRVDDNLKIPPAGYRQYCCEAIEAYFQSDPRSAEFAAAFGCETLTDGQGNIQDTSFRTMSGAGHQHFLAFMRDLIGETTEAHLREALFGPWRYADPGPSLRWDPEDDRRYALRWHEPSTDPLRTVRGANRLAFEALPLLPVIPTHTRAITTGFIGQRSYDTFWTWPIWSGPISLDVCRSLLALSELVSDDRNDSRATLFSRGIVAIFRSQRISIGKYRNFTPAFEV